MIGCGCDVSYLLSGQLVQNQKYKYLLSTFINDDI